MNLQQFNFSRLAGLNRLKVASHPRQQGVALIVVLIFIVALTSLAIYSSRDVSLSERVARNQLDIQVAREAAEAALRDAEFDLLLTSGVRRTGARCARTNTRPVVDNIFEFSPGCVGGQCALPQSLYDSSNFSSATTTTTALIIATTTNNGSPTITGEPWWPLSKGGQWNDDASTKATAVDTNCSFSGAVPFGTFSGKSPIIGVARQPEYIIEYLLVGKFFRISARGFGRNPSSEVVLQTYFRPFQ
jgi:type IV pilus assembly protein PilX